MSRAKIAISLDEGLLSRLDRLVKDHAFPNRSKAIETAVAQALARMDKTRLARQCAMLDPGFEKALAEEGLAEDADKWPEY